MAAHSSHTKTQCLSARMARQYLKAVKSLGQRRSFSELSKNSWYNWTFLATTSTALELRTLSTVHFQTVALAGEFQLSLSSTQY